MENEEKRTAVYRKKPSPDWLEKDQRESVISVQTFRVGRKIPFKVYHLHLLKTLIYCHYTGYPEIPLVHKNAKLT